MPVTATKGDLIAYPETSSNGTFWQLTQVSKVDRKTKQATQEQHPISNASTDIPTDAERLVVTADRLDMDALVQDMKTQWPQVFRTPDDIRDYLRPFLKDSEKGASMIAQGPEWGTPKEEGPMTPEEAAKLPQSETTERGPDWEPVSTETPPKTMTQVLAESAKAPEGSPALTDIPLTATDGTREITHNAEWWKNAIDKRIEALNKLRGCA
jgi:hypothetical protein